MKCRLLILATLAVSSLPGWGQDNNVLKHYSLSGGLGSTGLTIDMGTMMTDHLGLRAGVDLMRFYLHGTEYSDDMMDINYELNELDSDIRSLREPKIYTHITNSSGHLLVDYYPFSPSKSEFHVTVGAYLAWHRNVETYSSDDERAWRRIADFNARRGDYADVPAELGQVRLDYHGYEYQPADDGTVNLYMRVNRFRPYLGIGFGRAVPGARRLNAQLDLGVQFWGRPRVHDGATGERLTYVKNISHPSFGRNTVYPVITVRLAGRIM